MDYTIIVSSQFAQFQKMAKFRQSYRFIQLNYLLLLTPFEIVLSDFSRGDASEKMNNVAKSAKINATDNFDILDRNEK